MPNAKVLESKKAVVEALSGKIKEASSVVFVDYKGISVADDLPICTKIQLETVSASNPVINATAGQEIDLTSYIYEFSDGSAHIGTAMDWDFADTNAR